VGQEVFSWDGKPSDTGNNENFVAVDGAMPHLYEGKHTSLTRGAGILSLVLNPQSLGIVQGIASYIMTTGDMLDGDGLLGERVGLVVTIGNRAKNGGQSDSVSGQIAYLRGKLTNPTGVWGEIINGTLPLIIRVHQRDEIAALLRLHTSTCFNCRFILVGAMEAHFLAAQLALKAPLVSVMLGHWKPFSFDTFNAVEDAYSILFAAGVSVALVPAGEGDEPDQIAWFQYDAARLTTQNGITTDDALQAITKGVADIYQLDRFNVTGTIAVDSVANLVVWSGDPFAYTSQILVSIIGGHVSCLPPFMNV